MVHICERVTLEELLIACGNRSSVATKCKESSKCPIGRYREDQAKAIFYDEYILKESIVIAKHLLAEEVEVIRDMFTLMDTDNDGKVTYEELRDGLPKVGSQLAEPEIKILMEVVALQQPPKLACGCLFLLSEVLEALVFQSVKGGLRIFVTGAFHGNFGGVIVVLHDEKEARAEASLKFAGKQFQMSQDPDVLDTWFSSGLFPSTVVGWPEDTDDLRAFYPTSALETGHDILFSGLHAW
ncbi:Valine--tRNA ligase [Euphorbia peplus]|nr:Valine--tRNA ligase [Euphorbia peplus]